MSGPSLHLFLSAFRDVNFFLSLISELGTSSCSFDFNTDFPLHCFLSSSYFVSCLSREHAWQPQFAVGKTFWSNACFLSDMGSCSS